MMMQQNQDSAYSLMFRPLVHNIGGSYWLGDAARFFLNTYKLQLLGWKPRHSSYEAVAIAAEKIYRTLFK